MSDKRKAGDYEIIHEMRIGEKEIVVGELPYDSSEKYMCSFYKDNGIIAEYSEALASDSYAEIIGIYGERIKNAAEKCRSNLEHADVPAEDKKPYDISKIKFINHNDEIKGKVIVIKPDVLRREYKAALYQLKLCTGGFGSYANARGRTCYCTDLFTGRSEEYYRSDVLGTADESKLPEWAKKNLDNFNKTQKEKESRTER